MLDIDAEDKNNNEILECPYLINLIIFLIKLQLFK